MELEHERPALTDDAVPTIFPDAPLYFTKHVPKRRKERDLGNHYAPPPKRMALDEGMPDCELTESVDVQSASETSAHPFSNVSVPSAFCTKIVLWNEPGELCFGWHIRGEKCRDVLVHKHVTFAVCSEMTQEQAGTWLCCIYWRNVKVDEFFMATESDVLAALKLKRCFWPLGVVLSPSRPVSAQSLVNRTTRTHARLEQLKGNSVCVASTPGSL